MPCKYFKLKFLGPNYYPSGLFRKIKMRLLSTCRYKPN